MPELVKTIDEILIDVQGYANNQTYKIFYAVFYVSPGLITKQSFDAMWKARDFPDNWKGILVEGN